MPERSDIHPYKIMFVGIALVLCVLLVTLIARQLMIHFHLPRENSIESGKPRRLLSDPTQERAAFDVVMQRRLHSYSIDNSEPGYAHIPIERAMQLHAQGKGHVHD